MKWCCIFIECMHVHLENARPKMQGQLPPVVQTNAYTPMPYSGGVREHQVHFTPQVNQGQHPPAVQTNTSTYVPFFWWSERTSISFYSSKPRAIPSRCSYKYIYSCAFFWWSERTSSSFYSSSKPSNFTPQFLAYSGIGGQQHDLQKMVLDVMQEPDTLGIIL